MEPHRKERTGLYRPRVPSRIPRSIPDEEFNEIFARLPSNRDRALVAFYVSTGARASELLSATRGDVDPDATKPSTTVRKPDAPKFPVLNKVVTTLTGASNDSPDKTPPAAGDGNADGDTSSTPASSAAGAK